MPKYVVETLSMFRMRYVIESDTAEHAMDEVTMEEVEEFGQKHLGETIISTRVVSDEEIRELFYEEHPYLESWGPEKAFEYVHKRVKYD